MIQIIPSLPADVIGFEAIGTVTAHDYETVLMPAVEAASSGGARLRLLYFIGPEFDGFELGAIWDDAKVGLQHVGSWHRIALVSDVEWIRSAVWLFGFALPGHVRTFPNSGLDEARQWVSQ